MNIKGVYVDKISFFCNFSQLLSPLFLSSRPPIFIKIYIELARPFDNLQLKFHENRSTLKGSTSALFFVTTEKMPFFCYFWGRLKPEGKLKTKTITEEKNLIGTISIYFYLKIFNMNQINILKIFNNKGRSANSWMRQLRFDESVTDGRTDGPTDKKPLNNA